MKKTISLLLIFFLLLVSLTFGSSKDINYEKQVVYSDENTKDIAKEDSTDIKPIGREVAVTENEGYKEPQNSGRDSENSVKKVTVSYEGEKDIKVIQSTEKDVITVIVGATSEDCLEYQNDCKSGNTRACDKWDYNCKEETDIKTKENVEIRENKIYMGEKEIKIMPATASEKAIETLKLKQDVEIELKDTGKPIYEINGKKNVMILALIKTEMKIKTEINAETGKIELVKKPWWSFLTKEDLDVDEESNKNLPNSCTLQRDVGPCKARMERYYYNQDTESCEQFIWGGCGGVVPFETLEDCKSSCGSELNDCPDGQLMHQGFCKPIIIELNDDYSDPEEYLSEYIPFGVDDTESYNFNYPPLIEKVNELTQGITNNYDKMYSITNWVYNSKCYGNCSGPIKKLDSFEKHIGDETMESMWNVDAGVCHDAAMITVAMLNKAGYPALIHDIQSMNHVVTLFNLDGVWRIVDTTFHKPNSNSSEEDLWIPPLEFLEGRFYIIKDSQGNIFNEQKNQYCNYKSMMCSDMPFTSLKIFIPPNVPTVDVFFPAENIMTIPPNQIKCEFRVINVSCASQGCTYTPSGIDPALENPIMGIGIFNPFRYENDETKSNIGYVHLKMPMDGRLTYKYRCFHTFKNETGNVEIDISYKNGNFVDSEKIIIKWDNIEKSSEVTQEEFNQLISHLKSLTEDLGIIPE